MNEFFGVKPWLLYFMGWDELNKMPVPPTKAVIDFNADPSGQSLNRFLHRIDCYKFAVDITRETLSFLDDMFFGKTLETKLEISDKMFVRKVHLIGPGENIQILRHEICIGPKDNIVINIAYAPIRIEEGNYERMKESILAQLRSRKYAFQVTPGVMKY